MSSGAHCYKSISWIRWLRGPIGDNFPQDASPDRLAVGHGGLGVGAGLGVPADRAEDLPADGATAVLSPVTIDGMLRSKSKPGHYFGVRLDKIKAQS